MPLYISLQTAFPFDDISFESGPIAPAGILPIQVPPFEKKGASFFTSAPGFGNAIAASAGFISAFAGDAAGDGAGFVSAADAALAIVSRKITEQSMVFVIRISWPGEVFRARARETSARAR